MKTETPKKEAPKDRVDLRLFNTIAIYDVYMVARDGQAAREALEAVIASGELKPTELTATETRNERFIRESWRNEKPFVAADLSDDDFERVKGSTVIEAFQRFYQKR